MSDRPARGRGTATRAAGRHGGGRYVPTRWPDGPLPPPAAARPAPVPPVPGAPTASPEPSAPSEPSEPRRPPRSGGHRGDRTAARRPAKGHGAPQPITGHGAPSPGRADRRSQRRAERRAARRRRNRRLALAGGAVLAVVLVLLLLVVVRGGSHRHGKGPVATGRTQVTLLLMVKGANGAAIESALLAHDPATRQGAVVPVPSTLVADVPGRGQLQFGQTATLGSARVPAETLGDVMGVTVDGALLIDTTALGALVDHLGGVDVDHVDTDVVVPGPGRTEQVLVTKGGAQHLSGAQAVAYATYRGADETEQARLARFTTVLTGLIDALPAKASDDAAALQALGGGVVFGLAPARTGAVLAGLHAADASEALSFETLPVQPVGTGDDLLTPQSDQIDQLVHRYLAASVPAARASGHNRVIVVNGTGALGLGETAHAKLDRHGLVFVHSENQQGFSFAHEQSVVLVPDDSSASHALGHRVAAALGLPDGDIAVDQQPTSAADAVVILGTDYRP
ncbi:MAG: LCP family protein [Frankiaceae bacterium]